MWWQAWRIAALLIAVLAVGLVSGALASRDGAQGFAAKLASPSDFARYKVARLDPQRDIRPDLHPGDVIHLQNNTLAERLRYARKRVGERFVFDRDGGTPVTVTLVPAANEPVGYVVLAIVLAFAGIGALLALRRPRLPEVRALASMLLLLAVAFTFEPQSWMPIWLVGASLLFSTALQFTAFGCAVHLATVFPDPSAGGWRARIRRINPPVVLLFVAVGMWIVISVYGLLRPPPTLVNALGRWPWLYYLIAITTAFWIANRKAAAGDRTRVRWVSLSLALGFAGPLVNVALLVLAHLYEPWQAYLTLTLLAIPAGLGYAIVRHRVVDIGFVVNRALVFGIISGIIVLAMSSLEWLLGNVLVKVSHVTGTSLELGLALLLGISLRSIHARVHRFVDDVFFRDRHEAERALTTFAREVAFITDPRVAIDRAHDVLVEHAGATSAAVYVVDGAQAVRVDPAETAAPPAVDADDPALVRMRANRGPCDVRRIAATAMAGDHAFPMCVRDAVTGAIVLGAKANGEAYAPDELATIELVALALGNALDALQTAALKAEVARVLLDGAPIEGLRRTVDAAGWVRGVAPQPAGSALGLRE